MPKWRNDKPRLHHYEFAHRALPGIAFNPRVDLAALANAGHLDGALRATWAAVGERRDEADRLPDDGLQGELVEPSSARAANGSGRPELGPLSAHPPAICLSHLAACSGRPGRTSRAKQVTDPCGVAIGSGPRSIRAPRSSGGRRQACQLLLVLVQRPVDLYFVVAPPEPHRAEPHGAQIVSGDRASGQWAQPERALDPVDELIHLDHVVSGADPSPAEPVARLRSHHACTLHDGPAQFQPGRSPAADADPGRQNRLRAEPGAEQWQRCRQMLTSAVRSLRRVLRGARKSRLRGPRSAWTIPVTPRP